jgi:hypothetical protein
MRTQWHNKPEQRGLVGGSSQRPGRGLGNKLAGPRQGACHGATSTLNRPLLLLLLQPQGPSP